MQNSRGQTKSIYGIFRSGLLEEGECEIRAFVIIKQEVVNRGAQ